MCDVLDKVENKGKAEGKIEGKNQMALLVKKLLDQSRIEDVKRASEDETYRDKPMKELGIILSISLYSLWTLVRKFFQKILFSRPLHPIVLRIQITGNSGTHELFHKIFTVVTCFPCKLKEATLNVANLQPE